MSTRRPVAPDGAGGLSQIVSPDTIDATIIPAAFGRGRPFAASGGVEPRWMPGVEILTREDFTPAANTTYYCPFWVTNPMTITAVVLSLFVAVAASTCRVGVYPAGLDLEPSGALVGDVGLSTAATGAIVGTVSWVLQPGRYLMACNFSSAAISLRAVKGVIRWITNDANYPQATIQSLTKAASLGGGALPSTGPAWDTITAGAGSVGTGASFGIRYPFLFQGVEST